MTDPAYVEYTLAEWLETQGCDLLRGPQKLYQGYVEITKDPPEVHMMVIRWLLWVPWYERHIEKTRAHEWMHCHRKDAWHDPEPRDLMSARIWNSVTDKQNARVLSLTWRKRIRGLKVYKGTPSTPS